jgi:hypothetical protein
MSTDTKQKPTKDDKESGEESDEEGKYFITNYGENLACPLLF